MEGKKETHDMKIHFSKMHAKIQHKYEEMQKKLEKSRSVDALSTLHDDFNFKDHRHSSSEDLRESNDYDNTEIDSALSNEKRDPILTNQVIVEDVVTRNARFKEINEEESLFEADFIFIERDTVEQDKNEYQHFNYSVESLYEYGGDSDNSCSTVLTTSPPLKISIRDRISSKLSARKERRRAEKEREKENKKKENRDKVEKLILSNTTKNDILKTFKKNKVATLTVALIEASGLETEVSEEKPRLMLCRLRLGAEKHKSKLIKNHQTVVKWQELFTFNMYDENMLEVTLWDKDVFIGRSILDLHEIEKEKTHQMRLDLECDTGKVQLFILLTITGTTLVNTLVDLHDYEETQRRLSAVRKKFAWYHLKNDTKDVGACSIIVYGAKGLSGSECYCIVELGNDRLHTHTDSKTNDPNWMKIFTFTVKDITSILEITVHDEKKSEDIGKVFIPLLNIKNGVKQWYALKDSSREKDRARGNNPRILLEMKITWNTLRASMRVINPKEEKYLESDGKFQRHIFARNLTRAKAVIAWIMDAFCIVKNCFEWESRKSNIIALTTWLLFCWFFKMWMLPLLLLLPFLWYRPPHYYLINWKYFNKKSSLELEEAYKKEKEEKNLTLRQKINSLQEMVQTVQNFIGKFASLGESIKNLFNFTVPFLSLLAIMIISVISLVMYLVPVQYIFMIWGINKFTRKILRPNRVPNSEIFDLLSRVPDDETLLDIEELPLEEIPEEDVIK